MKIAAGIIRKSKKRKAVRVAWTKDQEARYNELAAELQTKGFLVRCEELKRGHCWKVHSGACRSQSQRLVFVDSRLQPEDQISFLRATLVDARRSEPDAVVPPPVVAPVDSVSQAA